MSIDQATNDTVAQQELEHEQEFVDGVYEQLERSTQNAQELAREGHGRAHLGHEGGLVERDAMVFQAAKRIATLNAAHEGRWLTVTIDDDGPGIPPESREEVFKPFVRLDEARNQDEGGTGLGLAIALDIARAHGGDVRLADSPLGGLRAVVRVPA